MIWDDFWEIGEMPIAGRTEGQKLMQFQHPLHKGRHLLVPHFISSSMLSVESWMPSRSDAKPG